MGNSKIVYYGETLIDLTGDTVEAAKLLKGVTAHDKKGEKITGTFEAADPYAIIGVTYPEGSVCTCTNGTLTLTAKGTSGKVLFAIPFAGTWTVKAVKGSQSASKAVSITAEGQVETVELTYELVLFDGANGGDATAITGGWKLSENYTYGSDLNVTAESITVSNGGGEDYGSWYGGTARATTKNTIDFSGYSTAEIEVATAYANAEILVGEAKLAISKSGTFTLDISNVTSGTVQITAVRPSETWTKYQTVVTKIRLY